MADVQIENHTSLKHIDQILPGASPSFDGDEIYVDETEEIPERSKSARSEKTVSTEEDAAQEAQSKGLLPSDTNELTPNTSSTSKSLKENAPPVIDLTGVEEDTKETKRAFGVEKTEEAEQRKDLEKNEHKTKDSTPLEPEKANEEKHKAKRKSKRESSSKRASSKPRKSKKSAQNPKEETDYKEKSTKKKTSKKKSVKKVAPTNSVKPAGEPSQPVSKTEVPPKTAKAPPEQLPITPMKEEKDTKKSSPNKKGDSLDDFKKRKDEKEKRADELRDYLGTVGGTLIVKPTTPTKQEKDIKKSSPVKKGGSPDDFKKRKEAKEKRADELRDYLGTVNDTLMVAPRSDDSVSFLTIPQAIQGDPNHHVDLNKLPKAQAPPIRTVNPMISMGDDGEDEPGRRISYDLEALMSHQVSSRPKQHKWENVSVITDDVETVLGENENAEIVSLQSNGIKFGHESRNTEFSDVDLEQPSKEAATAVDCKTLSRAHLATVMEDLENLMVRRPISASVIFVFLVATLVFLGIALMQ